jgi:hypothetical protein
MVLDRHGHHLGELINSLRVLFSLFVESGNRPALWSPGMTPQWCHLGTFKTNSQASPWAFTA